MFEKGVFDLKPCAAESTLYYIIILLYYGPIRPLHL